MSKDVTPALRTNRSFVIREGRFTDGQKKAFETLWPKYGIDIGDNDLFDPTRSFVNQQPLMLDVGFGNGDSLLSLAQQRPDMNFLGVEVYRPGIGAVLLKLEKHDINNVRVMNVDAMQLLKTHMPSDILAGVMVWFPDPWPKKRHHKRRLVQEAFLSELSRCMQNKGILHLASDWQPYVEFMFDHVALVKTFKRLKTDINPLKFERPLTRFEQRGLRKGHQVSDLIYQVNK
mgnify:CR=1 FL=1